VRSRRNALDYGRIWVKHYPDKGPNSVYYQGNATRFAQSNRTTAHSSEHDHYSGISVDTLERGRGAAVFHVHLALSATVTVDTGPAAMVDAATYGFGERTTEWTVDQMPLSEPVVVKYDPNLLEPAPAAPPVELLPPQDTTSSAPPPVGPQPPATATGPAPAIHDTGSVEPLSAIVRTGRRIDPNLLSGLAAVAPIGNLARVRAQGYRLAAPGPAEGPGILGKLSAAWRNNISDPPPNASLYRSRLFQEDFVYGIINQIYISTHIVSILTGELSERVTLPGRFFDTDADLEVVADVLNITKGRSTDDVMSKQGQTARASVRAATEMVSGNAVQPWINVDWALLGYKHYEADRGNAAGFLLGADYIATTGDKAQNRAHNTSANVTKVTGVGYTEVHFDVRWSIGLKPQRSWYPFGRPRQYLTERETRRITIWLPTHLVADLLAAPPVEEPGTVGSPAESGNEQPEPTIRDSTTTMPGAFPSSDEAEAGTSFGAGNDRTDEPAATTTTAAVDHLEAWLRWSQALLPEDAASQRNARDGIVGAIEQQTLRDRQSEPQEAEAASAAGAGSLSDGRSAPLTGTSERKPTSTPAAPLPPAATRLSFLRAWDGRELAALDLATLELAEQAVLTEPVSDSADLPDRLGQLAELTSTAAADEAQKADAGFLKAAELWIRGQPLGAVRRELGKHPLGTERKIAWIEWLDLAGQQNVPWKRQLSEMSELLVPNCGALV
jgi:hypothetical protein